MLNDEIIQALITKNEAVTQQFFYQNCRPLFYKLISSIFDTPVDYDELINELYLHLMENDAARLRSFKGNSSIYLWIKRVAYNYFLDLKLHRQVIENRSQESPYDNEDIEDFSKQEAQMDVAVLLDQVENERYRMVLQKHIIEGMSFDELAKITGLKKSNLYNIKKRALDELAKIAKLAKDGDRAQCAILCEEFVLHYFGVHKQMAELKATASGIGWLSGEGLDMRELGSISQAYGLTVRKNAGASLLDIAADIRQGYQVIVAVDGGELIGDPVEERVEDVVAGGVTDHCVVVLSVSATDDQVVVYDPAVGVIPLTLSVSRFMDAWEDSNYYMVTVMPKDMNQTYTPRPIELGDIELTPQLEQLREAIAENAHEVWAAGRIKEGWTFGPERDDKMKTHPDLVPYSELPDSEKEYDRQTAMNTIKLLVKLGYDLVRR